MFQVDDLFEAEGSFESLVLCGIQPLSRMAKKQRSFIAAYDGSGSIGKDCAYAYAGAVSSQAQWTAFAEKWKGFLSECGLESFKMAHAMKDRGPFEAKKTEWGKDYETKRDELVWRLARLKASYSLKVTGSGVATDNGSPLRPVARVADSKKQEFQRAIHNLIDGLPTDSLVFFTCDVELDVEESYRNWIQTLTTTPESDSAVKVAGIAFYDDEYVPSLQFADMAAWVVRQELTRMSEGRPESERNPLYDFLMEGSIGGIIIDA